LLAQNFGQSAGAGAADLADSPTPAQWAALEAFGNSIGDPVSVPEPASFGLVVLGGLGIMARRRRRAN